MPMFGRNQELTYITPPYAPTQVSVPDVPSVKPSFLGGGGAGRSIAGYLGDAMLALAGQKPLYAPAVAQQRQQSLEMERQMALARFKADNPDEPATIRTLRAAGIDPTSPQGRQIITNNLSTPHYMMMGSPETGQTLINPGAMPPPAPAGPQVGAVQDGYLFLGGDPANPASWRKQ